MYITFVPCLCQRVEFPEEHNISETGSGVHLDMQILIWAR